MANIEREISTLLERFGFSANTAKAYLSLVNSNPATGYEVSKYSAIPRSAIYGTLTRMEKMGIVSSEGGNPKRYIPLSPSSLIEHLQNLHENQIEDLKLALDKMEMDEETFDFWHLHGYRNLIIKAKEIINRSKEQIFLSVWHKEVILLESELKKAIKNGVDIILFSWCKLPEDIGKTVSYGLNEEDVLKVWNPKIILVSDRKATVMGSTLEHDDSRAILTENKAITEIAANHIILDITLAGRRLNFDPNPIVKQMMSKPDIHLENLLAKI